MPKRENPKRNLAFEIYAMNEGRISVGEIADQLGLTYQQVAAWKSRDQWDLQLDLAQAAEEKADRKKGGAPKGNSNAAGNAGTPENQHAAKSGAHASPRFAALTEEQREEILAVTPAAGCSTLEKVLYGRLQRELAKEFDLENRIEALRPAIDDDDSRLADGDTLMESDRSAMVYTNRSTAYTRIMQLETELGRTASRINRISDTIKSLQAETARIQLERERLDLAREKAVGIFEVPEKDRQAEARTDI